MGTYTHGFTTKRKFGGKMYILRHDASSKREAKAYASAYEFARIIKTKYGYDIYVR